MNESLTGAIRLHDHNVCFCVVASKHVFVMEIFFVGIHIFFLMYFFVL